MKKLLFVVFVTVLASCDATEPPSPGRILTGTWGGDDAGFIVADTAVHVHIGCTKGDIPQTVTVDGSGKFDVPGEYSVDVHPVARGIIHPARFVGDVNGLRLTLTVMLTDTAVTLGPVELTFGREPDMRICPICRVVPAAVTPVQDD